MDTQQIADLAWAGQHEQAIAAASCLKRKTLAADERMTLLDLRSEGPITRSETGARPRTTGMKPCETKTMTRCWRGAEPPSRSCGRGEAKCATPWPVRPPR
jgi:hypothetical protein